MSLANAKTKFGLWKGTYTAEDIDGITKLCLICCVLAEDQDRSGDEPRPEEPRVEREPTH